MPVESIGGLSPLSPADWGVLFRIAQATFMSAILEKDVCSMFIHVTSDDRVRVHLTYNEADCWAPTAHGIAVVFNAWTRPGLFTPEEVAVNPSSVLHRALNTAAAIVQGAWRRSVSDPRYLICRKRLRREFEEM